MGIFLLLLYFYVDFKGIWIPRWSITDHQNIFTHLDGEFNHIFLQVFALGEAYYPSKYAPTRIENDQWLKDFLDEAHRRGMRVSAWINVFYSWGYAPRTTTMSHPINLHPNWYVQDIYGRSILDYDINELKSNGLEGHFFAPASASVREYIINIINELITNYNFDGIHLDYVRYPGRKFVNDVSLRSKFMRRYCIDPIAFSQESNFKKRISTWGYVDLNTIWQEFIKDDLTTFIEVINKNIKRVSPGIQLSAAVKADYSEAAKEYYQDWQKWLNTEVLDFVCLMAYGKDIKKILHKTLRVVRKPQNVMIGLGLYCLSPEQIKDQVNLVKSMPFSGVVFFSYEDVKKNRQYLNPLSFSTK